MRRQATRESGSYTESFWRCFHCWELLAALIYFIDFGRTVFMSVLRLSLIAAVAVGLLGVAQHVSAAVGGPFTVDANTLHLWHFDDTAGPAVDSVSGGLNLLNVDQSAEPANVGAGVTPATANAIFGSTSFTGFGTSVGFANNALAPAVVNTGAQATSPQRPILIGGTALSTNDSTDAVPFSFANATTGAFTWEAIVKFDSSFDPANAAYRIGAATAPGSVGGGYPMEIISGEGDANAGRNWQFRFDQIGTGTASTANGVTKPRLEFANLHQISGNQSIAVDLPTTGANAVNNTDWFHVAVQYNGSPNTANNLSFFWTDISTTPSATLPALLAQVQMTQSLATTPTSFAIGDEARDAGSGAGEGESFVGKIDEVRMSGVARYAVPEPSAIALAGMGIVGLASLLRRRK
jgi:hypothetical protein